MRLNVFALSLIVILGGGAGAAVPKAAHGRFHAAAKGSFDKRFTIVQRKKLFAGWMNISYRAMYDAKGNEILGDQLADKYRHQFLQQHKMSIAEGHALELEGAAKQWPTQVPKTP